MASPNHPHSDSDSFDPEDLPDQTYELTTPSQDGLRPRREEEDSTEIPEADEESPESSKTFLSDEFDDPADDEGSPRDHTIASDEITPHPGDSSQTFISDEFDAPVAADSQTFLSDEFEAVDDEAGEESRTFVSDEFDNEDASASKTVQSDEFSASDFDSQTIQSDEFEEEDAASSRTVQSDQFSASDFDSQTIQSDEFDDADPVQGTYADTPEEQQTYVSDPDGPRWGDTGGRTIVADIDGTSEDSRTIQSDEFDDSDAGLMAQSNINQTINPKSLDSADRQHWDDVIRGALGSQAVPQRRRKGDSSLVGVGSNLNIQTRTLVEGQPAAGVIVDYRIDKKLGEGGMGAVYLANQTSLNRNVALKVIKPISDKESKRLRQSGRLQTIRQHREGQFLSEAVVTGDLEHPNIVPIYDVASTQDGTVFYSMKCVAGTPWSKVIRKKSLHENVDILLKVCDAIAFAHSRGVVHRDLKPENVMLGEFGVVLVMDWGLALTTAEFTKHASIKRATSLGGSPAYMAPELATGPIDRITGAADIYLIGAMLYEIMTGRPPHSGSNVSQCLRAAATNKIDTPREQGELMDIAFRAMATKVEDRYASVQEFQEAVRGYLSHAESIGLAHKAKDDLEQARQSEQYSDFARAMFGFEQALDLWEGNEPARQGLSQAQLAYAEHALKKTDYELGLSLLDAGDPAHAPIVSRLRQAQQEQDSRKARLTWMKRIAVALLAIIFVGGGGALAVITEQRNEAVTLRQEAEESRDLAIKSEQAALQAKEAEEIAKNRAIGLQKEAERAAESEREAKLVAVAAKEEADMQRMKAEEARKRAEAAALAEMQAKELEVKAKEAAILAQQRAIAAQREEEKAKILAVAAKEEAVAERLKAEEARKKAEAAALAEMKAKELETKAKEEAVAERLKAEEARKRAEAATLAEMKAKELETKAKEEAILAQLAEEKAKLTALEAKEAETRAKEAAILSEQRAQYEAYIAKIGLAKARIDQNEFESARSLLQQLKQDPATSRLCGWEWGRLMHQASQATSDVSAEQPARDVSFSARGSSAVAAIEGGRVQWFNVSPQGELTPDDQRQLLLGAEARSAAISPDERWIVTGEEDGLIRLWSAESGQELRRLPGHTSAVSKVRFLSSNRLISCARDKTVRVWDVQTGTQLAIGWHIAAVEDVAFSEGPPFIIAAAVADSRSGRVVVWRIESDGSRLQLLPVGDFLSHAAPVYAVAVTPDGKRIASGDGSGRILLWEREGLTRLDYGAAIDAALDRLNGPATAGSGRLPTTRRTDSAVAYVSLDDSSEPDGVYRLLANPESPAHDEAVRSLAFSHTGDRLVSAADDFTIKIWNPVRNRLEETLRGHGGWVRGAAFAPNNDDLLLSGSFDRSVKSWRLSQYSESLEIDLAAKSAGSGGDSPEVQAHDDEIWSARFSRDGRRVVTTSRDRSARVWTLGREPSGRMVMQQPVVLSDAVTPRNPQSLSEGHRYLAMSIHATPDGQSLLIGGVDGTIRIFDVARGTESGSLTGCGLNTAFALSSDGRLALTAASATGASALLWELGPRGQIPAQPRLRLGGHEHPVTAFAISADGQTVYTGDQRGIGYLWSAQTGEKLTAALSYHGGLRINAAAFLPDGKLVTASDDLSVTVYDPAAGEVREKFMQPGFVSAISVSPDGRRLLAISEKSDAETRDAITSLVLVHLDTGISQTLMSSSEDGPKVQIRSARFAPDSVRFVTLHGGFGAPQSLIRLWESPTDRPLSLSRTLRIPERLPPGDAALLLSNQRYELVTLHGNAAYQWSLKDLEHHQSFRSHGAVTDAAFSADGRFVATCSESVKIWEPETGKAVFHLEAPHAGAVFGIDFTPQQGRYLFTTAGADGLARVWEWLPQEATVQPVQTLGEARPEAEPMRDVRFSPDGQLILAVGDGGEAGVWRLGQEAPVARLIDPKVADVDYLCGAFADDGQTIAVGAADKSARLWSLSPERLAAETNPPLAVLEGHADRIESVAFLPSEPIVEGIVSPLRVLTASRDRSARVWDAATGREVISLRRHSLGLTAVDATQYRSGASESVSTLVLTAGLDGRLVLWPAGP